MLLAFTGATAALAASYDDFANGLSAIQRDNNQTALADFTAALNAGDLAPGVVPLAYRGRGLAHVRLGHCQLALADLDETLKQRPDDIDAQVYRADAHLCARDFPAAVADYTAILDKHQNADVYAMRGRVRLRTADNAGAVADFTRQTEIQPKNAYAQLWLFIARRRAGTFDAKVAAKEADRFSSRTWPGAVLQLYTGDETVTEVYTAAARADQKAPEFQTCEADFYVAEYLLATADTAGAKGHFADAVARCPKFYAERLYAALELEQLK
jgi:lipoprotein NlpI